MVNPNNPFAKTICSICYEDLKPIVEDLQAISICGHVFHELCLQQWFEYCTNSKKQTCPVCKQGCSKKNVGRLYFQSVGDPILSQSQIPDNILDAGECPEVLRREVNRLETKVSGLTSALELHQKEVQQLTDELQICKDKLSKELTLKNEALRQKECIQSMLQTKSSDLVRSTLECSRLQEKNLALAKELAALKLVSDCNLEEEEIVKLARFGNEASSQDAVDVLKKSLVIRNKSYKELMIKCNSLGRGEARSVRKLEKAKEKIIKLKARVEELETAIEAKDNEVLRSLKASKKRRSIDVPMPSVTTSTNPTPAFKCSAVEEKGQCPPSVINLDEDGNGYPFEVKETNKDDSNLDKFKDGKKAIQHKELSHFDCLTDDEGQARKCETVDTSSKAHNIKKGFHQDCSLRPGDLDTRETNDCSFMKETPGLLLKDIRQVQSSLQTKAETSSPILLAEPGDRCFAGGLLGPDGGNMYLGKWCKRVQNKAPVLGGSTYGSSNGSDGLIAMGADGRGGRVKVLRSANQMTMNTKESLVSTKRLKPGAKSNIMQSQGCLQIEHFFGKAQN